MSGYDCGNKWVFREKLQADGADWKSSGRLFQSRGPAMANEWLPTVTHRDGRTSRRLEVDERRRPQCLIGRSATYCSWSDRYWGAVPWRARIDYDRQFKLDALGCSSKPVKTGESVCNMLRATKTSDRPSCRVEDGLETVKQASQEAS